MEIKLIDQYNATEYSIPLFDEQKKVIDFYQKTIFVESRWYSLICKLHEEQNIVDVQVYMGDFCLDTRYDLAKNEVTLNTQRIFEDCYDVVCIKVVLYYEDGNRDVFESPYLYVAIKKITCQYVQKMFEDIENNFSGIIDAFYSKGKKNVGIGESGIRGFNDTVSLLSTIYLTLKDMYPMFQQSVKKKIGEEKQYIQGLNVGSMDNHSINWLVSHPEYIKVSATPTPIVVKQKYYEIDMLSYQNKTEKYDTYENQVVLGFINCVKEYIKDKTIELERVIKEYEEMIPYEEICKLPIEYDLAYNSVTFYYKELLRILLNFEESFDNLYEGYLTCMKCDPIILTGVPRYTFVFRQQYHYRRCFETMVLWFEKGNCNLQTIGYFMKLKRLSKIFEYYSLLKLREAILNERYILCEEPRCLMYEEKSTEIVNYYSFVSQNGDMKISLYYEPYIYTDKIKNGLNLYATGYNFNRMHKDKMVRQNDFWTPDFVLKMEGYGKELYYIMDSKFASLKSVESYHIVELAIKYSLNIASVDEYYSKVAGVWALYPAQDSLSRNYKKNEVNSLKKSLPIIAVQPVLNNSNSMTILVKQMIELFGEIYDM